MPLSDQKKNNNNNNTNKYWETKRKPKGQVHVMEPKQNKRSIFIIHSNFSPSALLCLKHPKTEDNFEEEKRAKWVSQVLKWFDWLTHKRNCVYGQTKPNQTKFDWRIMRERERERDVS